MPGGGSTSGTARRAAPSHRRRWWLVACSPLVAAGAVAWAVVGGRRPSRASVSVGRSRSTPSTPAGAVTLDVTRSDRAVGRVRGPRHRPAGGRARLADVDLAPVGARRGAPAASAAVRDQPARSPAAASVHCFAR